MLTADQTFAQAFDTKYEFGKTMNINEHIQPSNPREKSFIKSALLLTIALFLISAPTPDPSAIADMTSNLIVIAKSPVLGL